jgi:hypothetical protein
VPEVPQASSDVAAFLAKSKVPRARALKKLGDVLRRAASGHRDLEPVRELWVFGSFARGASQVGDIDVYMLVDESRTVQQFGLDVFYGDRPFAKQVKAIGCSGASMVSIQPQAVFDEMRDPASPERMTALTAAEQAGVVPVEEPVIGHIVTGEPLAGPFYLLWARGDRLEWALDRLHKIPEVADAGRHERTCTVPLLDDLAPKISLSTAFQLAAQVRRGNVTVDAFLVHPAEAPAAARRALESRYRNRSNPDAEVSPRLLAGAAALHHLVAQGVDFRHVHFVDSYVTRDHGTAQIFIDFNVFHLYRAAAGSYDTGDRVINLWPNGRRGPWLAVEVTITDKDGVLDLYHWLNFSGTPETRTTRLLEVLDGGSVTEVLS